MAQITLDVPAAVLDATCARQGYSGTIANPAYDPTKPEDATTNPKTVAQTKPQFVKAWLVRMLRQEYQTREREQHVAAYAATTPPAIA
jgi:hypothetical protein